MQFMTKTLEFNDILKRIAKHAHTESSKSMLLNLKPSVSITDVDHLLNETNDMLSIIVRGSYFPFVDDFDIVQLFSYGEKQLSYSLYELLQIRLFLSMEKDIVRYVKYIKKLNINFGDIQPYIEKIKSHYHLFERLNEAMDVDGLIKDDATPMISQIRKDLAKFDRQLQDKLHKLLNTYSKYLSDNVIVIRNDRFCLCVKEAFKHKIKGITHDMSASGQTIYIEPEQTRQITANIENLKAKEKREIDQLLRDLSRFIQADELSLQTNLNTFVMLDYIQAKAMYAKSIDAIKPKINKEGYTSLVKAKHPLLDPHSAVPISLSIDQTYKILLITGPNTGGKTVALKTLGLLTLMTQTGILIPANETSEVAIFDQIFADIGDEQSIEQSLSTFSSHLTKIIDMLNHVKDHTLIILDEIGSGTDPNEGVSLAIAMLNAFRKYDVRMLVTTHYAELKHYAFEQSDMQTASVAFDQESLKPLYYIQMGMTGSSQAFHIAKKLGLNQIIIDDATHLYRNKQSDVAKMMEKLNQLMQENEKQKQVLEQQNNQLRKDIDQYEKLKHDLMDKQDEMIEKIKQKELKKWQNLQEEARAVIKSLENKQQLSKPESASYKHKLNQSVTKEQLEVFEDSLKVGDFVYIKSYQQYGTITAIKQNKYQVKFGNFELKFEVTDLVKNKAPNKKKQVTTKTRRVKIKETEQKQGAMRLDLRGFRYEDVYDAIDRAVDQAIYNGLHELTVIHGFGTGAVKNAVYAYIKQSSLIKSHRFGKEGEGLNGVTVITLK